LAISVVRVRRIDAIKTEQAFVDIKSRLARRPIIVATYYSKPFIVAVDASDFAIGASLIQEGDG